MRSRTWMLVAVIAALAVAVTVAAAGRAERPAPTAPELTPEQKALVTEAKDLAKQIRIAQLELALAEAKDEPEGRIAEKAENLYRLRGKLHALSVKHPEVARALVQERGGRGWRGLRGPGGGRGRRGGLGMMGRGGMRGLGMGRGPGRGMGLGRGRGQGMVPGGQFRERLRLRLDQPNPALAEPVPAAPEIGAEQAPGG